MKASILIFELTLLGLLIEPARSAAQGTLFISNLSQPPTGSGVISRDSWIAQEFVTGTNSAGYSLNSVEVLMNAAAGTPGGFTVSVYSKTGDPHSGSNFDTPKGTVGSLAGPDPFPGGTFSYAASDIILWPHTFYYVVLTAATPASQGSYEWSAAYRGSTRDPGTWWSIEDGYCSSVDGLNWTQIIRQNIFQMAIYATPIPEPSETCVALLGAGILLVNRTRRRKASPSAPKRQMPSLHRHFDVGYDAHHTI